MIRGIVHGRVFKPAETKTSGSGKTFATATVALDGVLNDSGPRYARVIAFGETADALSALPKGAALAATGKIEISVWQPDGKPPEAQIKVLADDLIVVKTTGATVRRNEPVTP